MVAASCAQRADRPQTGARTAGAPTAGAPTAGAPTAGIAPGRLAALAVEALVAEASLTPKPALVDRRGSGAHGDMDLALMVRSAEALEWCFHALAVAARGRLPDQDLRERLAAIGRAGEASMLAATNGANTHRGAIWVLGLLVSAASALLPDEPADHPGDGHQPAAEHLAGWVSALVRHPDRFAPPDAGRPGARARRRYGVRGAHGEAASGLPHVVRVGLPMLRAGSDPETGALDALMAIMAGLDDTCLLHRGGPGALAVARGGAASVLAAGGMGTMAGRRAFTYLDAVLRTINASPGGSADLLAAVLFLDRLGIRSLVRWR